MSQESLRRWIGDGRPRCGCFALIREEMNYESKEDSGSEKIYPGPPRVWLQDSQLAIAAQSEHPSEAETNHPYRRVKAAGKTIKQDR